MRCCQQHIRQTSGRAAQAPLESSLQHPAGGFTPKPVAARAVLPPPITAVIFSSRGNRLSRLTALPSTMRRCQLCIRQASRQAAQSLSPKVACSIPLAIQSANQLQLTLFYRHLSTAMIFSSRGNSLSHLTALPATVRCCQQHIRKTAEQAARTLPPKVTCSIPLADSVCKPVTARTVLPTPCNRRDFQQSRE